jgi:hypothetical protein
MRQKACTVFANATTRHFEFSTHFGNEYQRNGSAMSVLSFLPMLIWQRSSSYLNKKRKRATGRYDRVVHLHAEIVVASHQLQPRPASFALVDFNGMLS